MGQSHDDGTADEPVRILFVERRPTGAGDSPEALLREAGVAFHADRLDTEDGLRRHLADSTPDLIVAQYELPSLDGPAVLAIARRHCPEVPLVFVAAAALEEELIASLGNGAADYVFGQRLSRLVPVVRRTLRDRRERIRNRQAERALRESEEKFRAVAQSAVDAIVSIDAQGLVTFWNRAAEAIFGHAAGEVLGGPVEIVVPERSRKAHREGLKRVAGGGRSKTIGRTVELTGLRRDGHEFPVELSLSRWSVGGAVSFTGIIRDISERKRTEDLLRSMSITDELTGLYNRRGFLAQAGPYLQLARRTGQTVIVLFADLDDMKRINDTLGHSAGDRALTAVARVLTETFRRSDIIARLGGDEFAVLAVETADSSTERILARLHQSLDAFNATSAFPLSVSIGIVRDGSAHRGSVEALLARADAKMYDQKRKLKSERGY